MTKTNGQRVATTLLMCVCVLAYDTLPLSQTGFGQSGYMGGDTQQLTEGHDTGVRLGRRQECSDPEECQLDGHNTNQACALYALAFVMCQTDTR